MKSLQCIPETEENTILCLREEPGGHETKHYIMWKCTWASGGLIKSNLGILGLAEFNLTLEFSGLLCFFSEVMLVYYSTNGKCIHLPF